MIGAIQYQASGPCNAKCRDKWSLFVTRDGLITFDVPAGTTFDVNDVEDLTSIDSFFQALFEVCAIGEDEDESSVNPFVALAS